MRLACDDIVACGSDSTPGCALEARSVVRGEIATRTAASSSWTSASAALAAVVRDGTSSAPHDGQSTTQLIIEMTSGAAHGQKRTVSVTPVPDSSQTSPGNTCAPCPVGRFRTLAAPKAAGGEPEPIGTCTPCPTIANARIDNRTLRAAPVNGRSCRKQDDSADDSTPTAETGCIDGYFFMSGSAVDKCRPCEADCKTCTDSTTCTAAMPGHALINDDAVPCRNPFNAVDCHAEGVGLVPKTPLEFCPGGAARIVATPANAAEACMACPPGKFKVSRSSSTCTECTGIANLAATSGVVVCTSRGTSQPAIGMVAAADGSGAKMVVIDIVDVSGVAQATVLGHGFSNNVEIAFTDFLTGFATLNGNTTFRVKAGSQTNDTFQLTDLNSTDVSVSGFGTAPLRCAPGFFYEPPSTNNPRRDARCTACKANCKRCTNKTDCSEAMPLYALIVDAPTLCTLNPSFDSSTSAAMEGPIRCQRRF